MSLALMPVQAQAQQFVSLGAAGSCAGTVLKGTVHATVQAAVDGAIAARDSVIEICPGTYEGPITVNDLGAMERLVIRGIGADEDLDTVIQGGATPGPIIDVVAASTVDIKNLIVDGQLMMVPTAPGGEVIGVRYRGANGVLDNIIIQNIGDMDGSAVGIGLHNEGPVVDNGQPPEETQVELRHSTVRNVNGTAILADGVGVNLTVDQTVVIGPVQPSSVVVPNGFQLSDGAKGTVKNSFFTDFRSQAPGRSGSAFVFLCPAVNGGDVAIAQGNSVRNADFGASLTYSDGVRLEGNTFVDVRVGVLLQTSQNGVGCSTPTSPTRNSNIVDNLFLDPAEAGIALVNGLLGNPGPGPNTIQGNSIFTDVAVPMAPLFIDGHDNVISGNTIFAGSGSEIVDATTGTGKGGTANTYDDNRCFGGIQSDLCR